MQRVLLDAARKSRAEKRGGALEKVELDENHLVSADDPTTLLSFAEALNGLEGVNPKYRQIAELRFLCSFTAEETAEILGVSVSTLRRDWKAAVEWLKSEMYGD
jgi:RNA polymerase sigma factor (TIGR02999 family)